MQMIQFANVDDLIETFDARFANARVDFIESIREQMIYAFHEQFDNANNMYFSFDQLHHVIENALRLCVATHYAMNYAQRNNEFAHIDAYEIAFKNDATMFAIIESNDDDTINHICNVIVDDKLCIEIVEIDK